MACFDVGKQTLTEHDNTQLAGPFFFRGFKRGVWVGMVASDPRDLQRGSEVIASSMELDLGGTFEIFFCAEKL